MSGAGSKPMRISELAAKTGIPKETIHFYLREGLLPKPRKTRRNMAFYDQAHVDRLELIRRLQNERYLPLEVIRRVLKPERSGGPRGGTEDLELLSGLYHLTGTAAGTPLTRRELERRSGLHAAAVERAERAGLIGPASVGGGYEPEDLRTLLLLREAAEALGGDQGAAIDLAIESFALCTRQLELMSREEARLFFDAILRAPSPIELLDGMRRAREPQARFISLQRGRLLKREIGRYVDEVERAVVETGGPSAFALSEERLRGLGRPAARAEVAARAEADPGAAELGCFADFAVGQVQELAAEAERAIARHGRRPRLVAWIGAAAVEAGDLDRGIALLDEAAAGPAAPPIAIALCGAGRVRLGRRTIEQSGAGSALKQVGAGLSDLARLDGAAVDRGDALSAAEWLRALLLRARVDTSLPAFFGTHARGEADLRVVLGGLAAAAPLAALGVPAALELNAAYFLGVALGGPRSDEGRALFQRALAIDPEGPLAARLARM
jgi:DNA-binding transcriptional MerR regulator